MQYIYIYMIVRGNATMVKMLSDGQDVNSKPKSIGKFKTDEQAKNACIVHHNKACKMARAKQLPEPKILFN